MNPELSWCLLGHLSCSRLWERAAAALQVGETGGIFGGCCFYEGQMCLLVVDAVKPGALPLDPAPAESPFPCGGWSRIPPLQGVAQASNGTCFPRLRLWLLWLVAMVAVRICSETL